MILFCVSAAERDVCNDPQRAVARMLRELLGAVALRLDQCRDTGEYGGLGTSLLFGSEELSAAYPRGVGCYYQDVLVTADFSVRVISVFGAVGRVECNLTVLLGCFHQGATGACAVLYPASGRHGGVGCGEDFSSVKDVTFHPGELLFQDIRGGVHAVRGDADGVLLVSVKNCRCSYLLFGWPG